MQLGDFLLSLFFGPIVCELFYTYCGSCSSSLFSHWSCWHNRMWVILCCLHSGLSLGLLVCKWFFARCNYVSFYHPHDYSCLVLGSKACEWVHHGCRYVTHSLHSCLVLFVSTACEQFFGKWNWVFSDYSSTLLAWQPVSWMTPDYINYHSDCTKLLGGVCFLDH